MHEKTFVPYGKKYVPLHRRWLEKRRFGPSAHQVAIDAKQDREWHAESLAVTLIFLGPFFKSRFMLVKFGNSKENRSLMCRALAFALEQRYSVKRHYGVWSVDVPDWPCWLRCLWHGYADMSRYSFGEAIRRPYFFDVITSDGVEYKVRVVFDEVDGGIRYGSVV